MTKKERAIVLKAAELIESRKRAASCFAINQAAGNYYGLKHPIIDAYQDFYKDWDGYLSVNAGCLDGEDPREVRVLMLLTFAEVG